MLGKIEKFDSGKGGEVVVFLHGFGGCAAQWQDLQNQISTDAATVSYDLPGHAGSLTYPDFGPPKTAAKAVIAELNETGFDKWHLVGHSMGGAVSSLVGLFAPEKVASLTLLAPGGFGPEIDHPTLVKWAEAKTSEEFAKLLPVFFADGFDLDAELIEMHSRLRSVSGANAALEFIASQMAQDGKQGTLPLDAVLDGPYDVSLIWGTEDAIIPVTQARALQDRADDGKLDLHIVEGMGHMPAEEAPELVRQTILSHLS